MYNVQIINLYFMFNTTLIKRASVICKNLYMQLCVKTFKSWLMYEAHTGINIAVP